MLAAITWLQIWGTRRLWALDLKQTYRKGNLQNQPALQLTILFQSTRTSINLPKTKINRIQQRISTQQTVFRVPLLDSKYLLETGPLWINSIINPSKSQQSFKSNLKKSTHSEKVSRQMNRQMIEIPHSALIASPPLTMEAITIHRRIQRIH